MTNTSSTSYIIAFSIWVTTSNTSKNVQPLGKSTSDEEIAAYSLETGAVVVTYDADFVLHLDETACAGVLYFPDESLATGTVAQIIDTILAHYPASELGGILYAGTEWL